MDIGGTINFTGNILSNGSTYTPYSLLSDTTSTVLYVGGKHHNVTENVFVKTSIHNPINSSCHLRITGNNSTTTNDLSGTVIALNDNITQIRNYEAGSI